MLGLLSLCSEPEVGLSEVSEAVAANPELASRVIRMASSAEFGRASRVRTISDATGLLGLDLIRALALNLIMEGLSAKADTHPLVASIRRRSLVAATAARLLAADRSRREADEAFLAGLLAYVGDIGIVCCYPEHVGLLQQGPDWADAGNQTLRLGFNGPRTGAALLRHWGVPGSFAEAVEARDPDYERPSRLGLLLRRAVEIARLVDTATPPTTEQLDDLQLTPADYEHLLTSATGMLPSVAESFGADRSNVLRIVSTLRASVVKRALILDPELNLVDDNGVKPGLDLATGLPSRRAVERYLAALQALAAEAGPDSPQFGLVTITASYAEDDGGSQVARLDSALRTVRRRLEGRIRTNEILARASVDTVVLIAPATTLVELERAAVRLGRLTRMSGPDYRDAFDLCFRNAITNPGGDALSDLLGSLSPAT